MHSVLHKKRQWEIQRTHFCELTFSLCSKTDSKGLFVHSRELTWICPQLESRQENLGSKRLTAYERIGGSGARVGVGFAC